MGKVKRRRRKPEKDNPTGLPSIKDFEEDENNSNSDKEKAFQDVFEQLQSPTIEEKISALQTLESMSYEALIALQIAKNKVARIVGPLLTDLNSVVRTAAASALRNVADNGGDEAYTQLIKDDLMTPLIVSLRKHYAEWQPEVGMKASKLREEKNAFIQIVTLLWTLCEKDEQVVQICNNNNIMVTLLKFLNPLVYGMDMSIVAAQCAVTLCEDNSVAINEVKRQEGFIITLLDLKPEKENSISELLLLRTLVANLLMNANAEFRSEQETIRMVCKIVAVLSDILLIDRERQLEILRILPQQNDGMGGSSKKKVQEIRQILAAEQQALEILANLCSEEPGSENVSDLDESDDCEAEFMEEDSTEERGYGVSNMPVELVEVVTSHGTMKKVWQLTKALPDNIQDLMGKSPEGKIIKKQFHTLRCRAFLCLNNLLTSFDIDGLGTPDELYRIWIEIGTTVFKVADPNDTELLESATSAMRAVLQKLTEIRANSFSQMTLEDLQPMLNGERQCPNPSVRINLIRILGNLALLLVTVDNTESRELVKYVSTFLLDACTKETEVWVMAEALDAIMDIYAEDETNQLAVEVDLVEKLQSLIPLFNNKIRLQKRNLGDNAFVVSTVKTNLRRFVKYKDQQVAGLR
ncbi:HEAT repeat-containing protein 3 [Orussus abietinus]|uniref:HEAT repeat-containing protein 3 n=1 Tax=Orussus abietinus TaxID=222816 RepID=UPI000626AF4A|nr:HEAT repeat-containing protein 3 [Orussus abietinus]